jgi:hypothetical protein
MWRCASAGIDPRTWTNDGMSAAIAAAGRERFRK